MAADISANQKDLCMRKKFRYKQTQQTFCLGQYTPLRFPPGIAYICLVIEHHQEIDLTQISGYCGNLWLTRLKPVTHIWFLDRPTSATYGLTIKQDFLGVHASTTKCLVVTAILIAAIAWVNIVRLSLPCPVSLPALNILIPFLVSIIRPMWHRIPVTSRKVIVGRLNSFAGYACTLVPFFLLTLSLVNALPADLASCRAELQWAQMFRAKNTGIRTIQNQLHCCGFNSLHDRAWPFPARGVNARACEITQGYVVRCGDVWQRRQIVAAGLTTLASLLNWILLIILMRSMTFNSTTAVAPRIIDQQTRLLGDDGEEIVQVDGAESIDTTEVQA